MPQKSVMPAKTNPAPTNADRPEKSAMHEPAEQHADEHQRSGDDAHLPFEADDFDCAARHRQIGFNPSERSAFDNDWLRKTFLRKFFRRFCCALAAAAQQINRLVFLKVAASLVSIRPAERSAPVERGLPRTPPACERQCTADAGCARENFLQFDRRDRFHVLPVYQLRFNERNASTSASTSSRVL